MVDDRAFRVVAIISAFNEEDVIGPTLGHLHENGIETYLIDNRSTDTTIERAQEWLGRGLLGIETFPSESTDSGAPVAWTRILERKVELAGELGADWYIHHDADEVRHAPWPGTTLRDALKWVDGLGFNAVEFRLLNFPPVDDGFTLGCDPKTYFIRWEEGPEHDLIQRKCWKAGAAGLQLADGGHDVRFDGRRLFPIRFLLRHYPIRGQNHGTRKVMTERKGRFVADEIALGWHRQYDHVSEGFDFLRNPATLREFDLEQVRLETLLQDVGSSSPALEGDEAAATFLYEGVLDRVDSKRIFGWARAIDHEAVPATIELWDGARKLVAAPANIVRPDLQAVEKGDGRAGFVFETPQGLLDGRRHWIWATVAGTTFALRGSPRIFCAGDDVSASADVPSTTADGALQPVVQSAE